MQKLPEHHCVAVPYFETFTVDVQAYQFYRGLGSYSDKLVSCNTFFQAVSLYKKWALYSFTMEGNYLKKYLALFVTGFLPTKLVLNVCTFSLHLSSREMWMVPKPWPLAMSLSISGDCL